MLSSRVMAKLEEGFPFLHSFSKEERDLFFQNSTHFHYQADTIIMQEGFICRHTAFLLKGSIRVSKLSEDGREVTLYRIREGEVCLLTVSCIMSDSSFPALASVEEETEMVALPAQIFQELLLVNREFQQFIFHRIFSRLRDVMLTVERVAFAGIEKRIAGLLYQAYLARESPILSFTHAEVAREIGSSREVVSRKLKELQEREILHLARGRIQVIDPKSLQART